MKALKFIGFGILGAALVILAIWITMSLWNWLIPVLFHGPVITFWQTAGLFILAKILFAGISPHNCRYPRDDYRKYRKFGYRHYRYEEKPEVKTEGESS
jgi:hypothetical protein